MFNTNTTLELILALMSKADVKGVCVSENPAFQITHHLRFGC